MRYQPSDAPKSRRYGFFYPGDPARQQMFYVKYWLIIGARRFLASTFTEVRNLRKIHGGNGLVEMQILERES